MMKRHGTVRVMLYTLIMCAVPQAQSIIISDDVFQANGGDLKNISGTIAKAMGPLWARSLERQFLSVGQLQSGGELCTATWLGDAADGKSVYFLTAAHCTEGTEQKGKGHFRFIDYAGGTTAAGEGTYITSPYRYSHPPGFGSTSTDIALVKLPKIADICDFQGMKIPQPVLFDLSDAEDELNKEVWIVGYGDWGTGTSGSNSDYRPNFGPRRAAGASTISTVFENAYGMGADFSPHRGRMVSAGIVKWARAAAGDSGSAWWQKHQGRWTIVADTAGGSDSLSKGTRIAQYVGFIKSIYPTARFLNDVPMTPEAAGESRLWTCLRHSDNQKNAIIPTASVQQG